MTFTLGAGGSGLPAFTRYSYDGGRNWFLLYYGGLAEVYVWGREEIGMLLDFTYADINTSASLQLDAAVYNSSMMSSRVSEIVWIAPVTFSGVSGDTYYVLNNKESLSLPMAYANGDNGINYRYKLERLDVIDEASGEIAYMPVEAGAIQLIFYDDDGLVTVLTGDPLPLAGTYRISIDYSYGWLDFASQEIIFFVRY